MTHNLVCQHAKNKFVDTVVETTEGFYFGLQVGETTYTSFFDIYFFVCSFCDWGNKFKLYIKFDIDTTTYEATLSIIRLKCHASPVKEVVQILE